MRWIRRGLICCALLVPIMASLSCTKYEHRGLKPADVWKLKPKYEETILPGWLLGGGPVCTFSSTPSNGLVASPWQYSRDIALTATDEVDISFTNLGASAVVVSEVILFQCMAGAWIPTASAADPRVFFITNDCTGKTLAPSEGCFVKIGVRSRLGKSKLEVHGPGGVVLFEFDINVYL